MESEGAFAAAVILPAAKRLKRDPHRFSLLARHLEPGEPARAVVSIPSGTLVATDRRILEFRPHLEVDGAWNVREFSGYAVVRELSLAAVVGVQRRTEARADRPSGQRAVEDHIDLVTAGGPESILISRGPEPLLSDEEFATLAAILLGHAK